MRSSSINLHEHIRLDSQQSVYLLRGRCLYLHLDEAAAELVLAELTHIPSDVLHMKRDFHPMTSGSEDDMVTKEDV